MRRKIVFGLLALNGLLGLALLARPAMTQIIPLGLWDCCKNVGPSGYCCKNCCWLSDNCETDDDCRQTE